VVDSKARSPELDELDASWDDDDVDAGWEDPEPGEEPDEQEPTGLTAEERESRAAARKERHRAKAAEKAQRRKARASAAAAKQKKSAPRSVRAETSPGRRATRSVTETAEGPSSLPEPRAIERDAPSARRSFWSRGNVRGLAFLVALLVLAGAVALVLSRR